ncbi:Lrp/AsnC family transcriptional regulator [Ideonella sp. 4Y11]|uniref:Lrp/AsnC family transcriptional regulator n=1 Tax=Ideonella aquatica TaxID=2824119 RepID=A0A941BFU7_9BURK|nr:Lrp/AsnC family transcriptional regulator [Ideonella aquatica]MBQ0959141.1 Lrp/AsnC family transcriptional regulator [Ideonella aquatica]
MSLPELDDFDRHLLTRMQADAHCKAETLAAEIGLSASAVQRRLKRLRERGVIQAEVAVLDPAVMGRGLTLIAGLTIGRDNYAALPRLRAWLAAEPAVQQAWYVTGEADLVALVLAPDMPAYDALCARLMAEVPQLSRITTQVVIEPLKRSLALPIA